MSMVESRRAKLSPAKQELLRRRLSGQPLGSAGEPPPLFDLTRDRVVPIPRNGPLPLSFNQEAYLLRRWATQAQGHTIVPFQIDLRIRFHGPLDVDVMRRVLQETVRRHEALRT